jgi:hypothetical protein
VVDVMCNPEPETETHHSEQGHLNEYQKALLVSATKEGGGRVLANEDDLTGGVMRSRCMSGQNIKELSLDGGEVVLSDCEEQVFDVELNEDGEDLVFDHKQHLLDSGFPGLKKLAQSGCVSGGSFGGPEYSLWNCNRGEELVLNRRRVWREEPVSHGGSGSDMWKKKERETAGEAMLIGGELFQNKGQALKYEERPSLECFDKYDNLESSKKEK